MAIPHNSKCRYGERGAADAKPKAQIILDAAKVSAASGGNSEPKQGQRSQSARGFCPRSTMRVPQPDIIEHFGNADAVPQPSERCLSRKAGIVWCCLRVVAIWKCAANNKTPCRARCLHRAGEKHKLRVTNLKTFVRDDACIVPRNPAALRTFAPKSQTPNRSPAKPKACGPSYLPRIRMPIS